MLKNDLVQRSVVGIPLACIIMAILIYSSVLSQFVIASCYIGCLIEWMRITLRSSISADRRLFWFVGGGIYITLGTLPLFDEIIKNSRNVLIVISVICIADIGAYFIGRLIGGPKLAPRISPNKTWSGLIGGFLCAFMAGLIFIKTLPNYALLLKPFNNPYSNYCYLSIFIAASQLGDLFESYIKRLFDIKDSGAILPGHGGFLDRLDSLLAAGIVILILNLIK